MVGFGSGASDAARAADATRHAFEEARRRLGDAVPRLAVAFFSVGYPDVAEAPRVLREHLGPDIPIVGGTAGGAVFGDGLLASRGVSVVLLGGDIDVIVRSAAASSSELLDVVPAADEVTAHAVAAAKRGFPHHACLVFAPGIFVDGEALVAAVRKGAGAGMQLAGALTGDDLTMDRPAVLDEDRLTADRVVLVGLCTRTPVGIAARHGWRPIGPKRVVTRADGPFLLELDGLPALDVWLGDAKHSGLPTPKVRRELALFLANHFPLGLLDEPSGSFRARASNAPKARRDTGDRELVARTPFVVREDGTIQLSASVAEGTRVQIMHGSRNDLLRASRDAASSAALRAGGKVSGALVLACAGRLAALGDAFGEEPAQIGAQLRAPFAGACVFGEIARNVRDADAFFNTTAVVVAFASGNDTPEG